MSSKIENIGSITVIIIGLVPILALILGKGDTSSLIILMSILVIIIVYFIADYIRDKFGRIDEVANHMKEIEKKVDYMKNIHDLDKRISLIESEKKKKGQMDPRIIIIIILVILLYLYFRSIGLHI